MPATSQLEWLISMTAMIVLFWSRATRDLLKSFGWGIAGTPSIKCSDEVAIPRRPPHSVSRSPGTRVLVRGLTVRIPCSSEDARRKGAGPAVSPTRVPDGIKVDGIKVDSIGQIYCTGPGGIWIMAPDGTHAHNKRGLRRKR